MHSIHFYDSAQPGNVPSGVYAAVYINGFAWSQAEIDRMGHVFAISVRPESGYARYARCLDVETGAASPDDVVPFLREREAHGHHDGTIYVNRSNWDQCRQGAESAGFHPYWWVATLDGTMLVADEWATQYYGGGDKPYDLSVLHGINNFRRP